MIRLSLISVLLLSVFSFSANAAQFVGQIISQYQSSHGEYHALALNTGDRILPIKFSSAEDERRYRRRFKRHSGKVASITGPIKRLESQSQPYSVEKYIRMDYHKLAKETKTFTGVIKLNKNARSHFQKYIIKEIDKTYPRSLQIVLGVFHDEDFLEKYQDQEVEIQFSEFYISWRKIRFVTKIKLL